ncbi:MAG: DUF5714 domain-containing protein [Christensenellales bacterium]
MDYSLDEKYEIIKKDIVVIKSCSPIEIVKEMMHKDCIAIHGPEHHFLDGAAFLTAYSNAGGNIDLELCLDNLAQRTQKMPGAMCAYWGVCGSVASVGAALSIIHDTQPLSNNQYYKDNLDFTSRVLAKMSAIGGPRCCKRNAFLSLSYACEFVREKYNVQLDSDIISCDFSSLNKQCIGDRCPFNDKLCKVVD